jgi:hypothetical protein
VTPPAGAAATPATPPAASPASPAAPAADAGKASLLEQKGTEAAPVKPDYSKLKLPDGTKLAQADLDAMKAWGEKHNLPAEVVQAALEEKSGAVKSYHDGLVSQHQKTIAENKKRIETHPQFGGANLKATDEGVTQVLNRFAPKGLMERIQQAGYQWDPEFLEFLMNVRTATKDDTFVPSGGAPPAPQPPKGLESMYTAKKS